MSFSDEALLLGLALILLCVTVGAAFTVLCILINDRQEEEGRGD